MYADIIYVLCILISAGDLIVKWNQLIRLCKLNIEIKPEYIVTRHYA